MFNEKDEHNTISLKNVISSFQYWPKIFKLLWDTNKGYLSIILVTSILLGIAPVISLYIIQELVNGIALGGEYGYRVVFVLFVFFTLFSVTRELLSISKDYCEGLFLTLYNNKISILVMDKSSTLGLEDFENPQVQDQLKRAQNESGQRSYQIFQQILSIITNTISISSFMVFLAVWKWWVVLLIILLPVSSFYSLLKLAQKQFEVHWERATKQRGAWYLSYLLTHDQAFKEVKIYKLGQYLINSYKQILTLFFLQDKDLAKRKVMISLIFFVGVNLSVIFFLVYQVIYSALTQEILIGSLVAYIQAITLSHGSSQTISNSLIALSQNNLYLAQLFSFLELTSNDPIYLQTKQGNKKLHKIKRVKKLEFRSVSFQYPATNRVVLDHISFTVEKGESLAIVGKNGSGKTTLVKLMTQLYDGYEGEIFVNDINIKECDLEEFRDHIGIVFQDFMRYEMPVRQNVGFGNVNHIDSDTSIYSAIQQSGLMRTIEQLPNGLDSQLGKWFSGGYQFSGGQWQRISIARAYMRDSSICLLDEPSASLDPESENQIFLEFKKLVKDRIGIFITHRYSSVRYADRILVMEEGRLAEIGTHHDLIRLNGVYAELYTLQASSYLERIQPISYK